MRQAFVLAFLTSHLSTSLLYSEWQSTHPTYSTFPIVRHFPQPFYSIDLSHFPLYTHGWELLQLLLSSSTRYIAIMPTLEVLSPEIQQQILSKLDDIDALHALIRASPRLYQVFQLNKDTILSTIALNQFHPAVRPEALAVARLAQFQQQSDMDMQSRRDTAIKFCDTFPNQIYQWGKPDTLESVPTRLCKLARAIRFFIDDYTQNTLPILDQLGQSRDHEILSEYPPYSHVPDPQLSSTEIGRLQRAFCRFELYRHLFSRCLPDVHDGMHKCPDITEPPMMAAEQANIFLQKLPPFQITEIACIKDYLSRRLRGILVKLEDEAVTSLPLKAVTFKWFDETAKLRSPFYIFTTEALHEQKEHLEHLMSLGLAYIRRIIQSIGDEQRDLFLHYIGSSLIFHFEREFISKALQSLGLNPDASHWYNDFQHREKEFTPACDENGYSELPQGWLWGHYHLQPSKISDGRHKGLRDWGYVFWDFDRLQQSGVLRRE